MYHGGNHDGNVKDLVAGAEYVKCVRKPPLRNLCTVSVTRSKNIKQLQEMTGLTLAA